MISFRFIKVGNQRRGVGHRRGPQGKVEGTEDLSMLGFGEGKRWRWWRGGEGRGGEGRGE